jgi:glucan phosphoethanolaminetransferase (alkaline phosphatase superfamily)
MKDKKDQGGEQIEEGKVQDEGWKLYYDMFKHLTTLNTGAVLIIVALLEKLFSNPKLKGLVGFSFLCFIISIITSLAAMNIASLYFKNDRYLDSYEHKREPVMYWTSLLAFYLGLVSLVTFTMINFYQ